MTNPQSPFLTVHTVLVLLTAAFGALAYWSAGSVPGAALIGLSTAGVSIPVLRTLIH
ncbi:hypothetical protein ABZ348_14930 [Streptomyces sp. NPDC005963]|uniref:hypothetical protein n=1 Tax=Streptomyces sp. NPDC005963 TaxID=3156721 RepID=UPI0033D3FFCC